MRLYLITDDAARSPDELAQIVGAAIDGGVTAAQFREKALGPTLALRAFEAVARGCHEKNVPLLLNADLLGRVDYNGELSGVHYSDRTLPLHPSARNCLCGYSAHGLDDAVTAFSHNVDFCTLSPIFPTPSKEGILDPVGTDCIKRTRKKLPGKVLIALGGIEESNVAQCMSAGATGIALIRAIMAAKDPKAAAARLRTIVEKCLQQ